MMDGAQTRAALRLAEQRAEDLAEIAAAHERALTEAEARYTNSVVANGTDLLA